MSELTDAVRERYAAKALQMAPGGVTGSLGLACDLTDGQRAQRQAEWRAVDAAALLTRAERSGTVISTYRAGPATRAELTRLVAAERVCCGTANWALHDDGAELRVTVDAASGACCEDDCCGATYSAEELASVGIDATAKGPLEGAREWPPEIEMGAEIRELVDRRWAEYGIDAVPPASDGRIRQSSRRLLRR